MKGLPAKSSRTSTQAMTVPMRALMTVDDARDGEGELQRGERLRRRDGSPELIEAIGHGAPQDGRDGDEDEQAEVGRGDAGAEQAPAVVPRGGGPPDGGRCPGAETHAASRPSSEKMLGHDAGVRIEEARSGLRPATQVLDGEEVGDLGIVELGEDLLDHGAEALLSEDALSLRRVQEVHEGRGRLERVAQCRHGHGVLDEHRRGLGDDEVDGLAHLLREDGLVLVADHDVALAGHEGGQRLAGAAVHDRGVGDELLQVVERLVLASCRLRSAPGRRPGCSTAPRPT